MVSSVFCTMMKYGCCIAGWFAGLGGVYLGGLWFETVDFGECMLEGWHPGIWRLKHLAFALELAIDLELLSFVKFLVWRLIDVILSFAILGILDLGLLFADQGFFAQNEVPSMQGRNWKGLSKKSRTLIFGNMQQDRLSLALSPDKISLLSL